MSSSPPAQERSCAHTHREKPDSLLVSVGQKKTRVTFRSWKGDPRLFRG